MITFKQQFTFDEDSVKGFAKHLGWQEKLTRQIEVVDDETVDPVTTHFETEEYDNPETFIDFVDKKAREHTLRFTKQWAENLVYIEIENQKQSVENTIKTQLENDIIKPVEDALSSEVITQ
jgi:hypothetical protein